ncbi:MAG: cytochrome c oxidase subunit 3 [Candidatus Neomarinimicrobiota bacterium]
MEIPYTVEARDDTGLTNPKLGIWLFLASELMLFGAMFSAYILLRTGASSWPAQSEEVSVLIGTANTMVLIASSVTMVMAWASLRMNNFENFRVYLTSTVFLALIFLIVKIFWEYIPKIHHAHIPSTNIYFALYYTMTGLHGLHVLGGVLVNAYFLFRGKKMWKNEPDRFTNRIEIAGLYWHFVDLVWIFLFPTLYLL